MNMGERNEYLIKFALILFRDTPSHDFKTVGFPANVNYGSLPKEITLSNLKDLSDAEIIDVANAAGIGKAPASAKSDVYINNWGVSLKYSDAQPPAILNHTHRYGILRICNELNISIQSLDDMVAEYWDLRKAGIIGEDVLSTSPNSPFKKDPVLIKIIEYFLFTGTGSKKSNYPASYILDFKNPSDLKTWKLYKPDEIIDAIWDKLVFSIRSKGMPDSFKVNSSNKKNQDIEKWTYFINGSYKGSIHIRIKN